MIQKKHNHYIIQKIKDVSIRYKIMGAFFLIISLLGFTFSINGYYSFQSVDSYYEENFARNIQSEIYARMESELLSADLALYIVRTNKAVIKAFAERDRNLLQSMFLSSFPRLKKMGIAQFQFHLPDSTSFLRIHKPEKYGDSLKTFRKTVNQANANKKIIRGLEEGRAGFGFRVVAPIYYEGIHQGTVEFGRNFSIGFLNRLKEDFGGEYYIYIFNTGDSVAWKGSENSFLAGTTNEDPFKLDESRLEYVRDGEMVYYADKNIKSEIVLIPFHDFSGEVKGYIKSIRTREAIYNAENKALFYSAGIVATGIIFSSLIAYIILILINGPLNKSMKFASVIASGDLTESIELDRYDETGKLILALDNMRNELHDLLKEINDNAEKSSMAADELAHSSSETSKASDQVSITMEQLAAGATSLNDSAHAAWNSVLQLDESQKNVTDTAQLGKKEADEISLSASHAGEAAENASQMILRIKSIMNDTAKSVENLTVRVQTINEMTGSINAITEQINLLSLNASIEAARAGDAGRGFAVVAESVSKLADQSGQATEQINRSITEIVDTTHMTLNQIESGVKEVTDGSEEIQNALEGTKRIHKMIQDLVLRMDSITDAVIIQQNFTTEVKESISSVSTVAEQSAAGAEEAAASIEEISGLMINLSDSAEHLQGGSRRLKSLIEKFKV